MKSLQELKPLDFIEREHVIRPKPKYPTKYPNWNPNRAFFTVGSHGKRHFSMERKSYILFDKI